MVLVGVGNNNINSAGSNQTWARLRFTQADTIAQVSLKLIFFGEKLYK